MGLSYFDKAREFTDKLEKHQAQNITKAAMLVSEAIRSGGILQAFGSGHSYAAAIEITGRAGGFIPAKTIVDPAGGMYETVEGVGALLTKRIDIQPEDVVVLISNSGRNPLIIELAEWVKANGNKLIVVTALDISKSSTSRHSSGKLLYEYADVVLDNMSEFGDAALTVEGFEEKVCGTSSFSAVLLLQQMIYEAVEDMVKKGFEPPVYRSANIDGGIEYNDKIVAKYKDRIYRF